MYDFIINDALHKVWCNPYQDNQHVIRPERVTTGVGALNTVFALGRQITLPVAKYRTHVFQIGQYPPALLGLLDNWPTWAAEKWFSFEQAMNELPLYVNVYNEQGVNVPKSNAFFMMTREKCLIMAVLADPRMHIDYTTDNIYLRVYTNGYLKSLNRTGSAPYIEVKTFTIFNNSDIANVQMDHADMSTRPGLTEIFCNGWWVSAINGLTVKPGDIVELIYDATVKRVVDWKIGSLKTFTSEMDRKFKYILHYNKSIVVDEIDFFDDIDIYIHYNTTTHGDRGYYYHKNLPNAMRMLTHRDYSIASDYVTFIVNAIADDLGIEGADYLDFQINMKVRKSGLSRKLIKDPNKIFELYKLPDYRILMAMAGVDSLVPPWWASNLEQSGYSALMGLLYDQVDITAVENGYGYDYTAQTLAYSPLRVKTDNVARKVDLPYELCPLSTMYEFDSSGKLLGTYLHDTNDDSYEPMNVQCELVEALVGKGSNRPDVVFGETNLSVTPFSSFRVYYCQKDYSVQPPKPNYQWQDITDRLDLYKFENNKVIWIAPDTDQYLMVRTDSSFISYNFTASSTNGNIIFRLTEVTEMDGVIEERPCPVPGGDIQLWLNSYNLVYGIDYVVNFPYVCINNYSYLDQPVSDKPQRIDVRITGFCTSDLKFIAPKSTGFVYNGCISRDGKYDIHDDKIMHISINGGLADPKDVRFYEDKPEWRRSDPANGTPYQITDIIVPLKNYVKSGTYELLDKSRYIDAQVQSYMDMYYEWPQNEPVSIAASRWRLVSPFFCLIVDMCLNNQIWFSDTENPSESQVRTICRPYEVLLGYDPVYGENQLPSAFVNITPTKYRNTVTVTRSQYRFLEKVVDLYGNGLIGLNNFVRFSI